MLHHGKDAKMTLFEMSLLWARVRGKGRGRGRSNNVIFAFKMTTERMTLNESCHA